jgi:Protein of unknown function DUF262
MLARRIEDHDAPADLGEMEGEEDFVFPPTERRLITQPLDLSIQTLLEQWDNKLLILPEIQREYVWDNGKESRLIESLILNIPIPVLYFSETQEAKYEIIDGHQRVRSIVRYLSNEFVLSGVAVLREYKGLRFHQLPDREQRFLRMRTLRTIIISVESHPNMKFEIYERLNTGAILLNAQELRNSVYRGSFNDLLRALSQNTTFRRIIGTKVPRKRMVDEELILRFFALHSGLETYRTPLKRFLNNYMQRVRNGNPDEIADLRSTFEGATNMVHALLGTTAFRVINHDTGATEPAVNRALFDAQMLSSCWVQSDIAEIETARVHRELAVLFGDESFMDSIQRATGDRARTLKRIRETVSALERAGLRVQAPFDLSR